MLACAAAETPELKPSFPNYAMVLLPTAGSRDSLGEPADPGLPFSWDQTFIIRQGEQQERFLRGFDPDFQQPAYAILPKELQFLRINEFLPNFGALAITARQDTGGNIEGIPFQIIAREKLNPLVYNAIFDIRENNTRIRGTPQLARSDGEFIRPGQTVRYTWTRTGNGERRPKVEAEFVGKTGPATGLKSSKITEVVAMKVQPYVLGHYLMTVTPRDILGEPPRGSESNGQVFRCAFGSQDLPPTAEGMLADTFTPAVGQVVTMRPFAIDPETAQEIYDNQTYDFGDGTVVTGVSGATTHAYAKPGIYRVRCTVIDKQGLSATAEDNFIVGATLIPKMQFQANKKIIPEEAGIGEVDKDTLKTSFPGTGAKGGDRIIFTFNRNRFGTMTASESGSEIVLRPAGGFEGKIDRANRIRVGARGGTVGVEITGGAFDRTADARLGRSDGKGVFKNSRIALCVVPADGSDPRVYLYTGNLQVKLKGFTRGGVNFIPEEAVNMTSTQKEPDPKKQELE